MAKLSAAYANSAAPDKTLDLITAVNAARAPARAAYNDSPLAKAFICAAQNYYAALRTQTVQRDAENVPLYAEYFTAFSAAKSGTPEAERTLVQVEQALCEKFPALSEKRDSMLESGQAFMRTKPVLALQLDLTPSARLWNKAKLALQGLAY
ncbi:MAG: hypothetical protein ACXW4B_10600 [Micavibrio sp.]